jgi:hypothetical protein
MTVARSSSEPVLGEAASQLSARLDLLIRRAITVEQFEADMVRCCAANPEEIWNLLGLLDQYHRLERLPTELFRSLKAAADRFGLVRREPYIPNLSPTPKPVAPPEPAAAVSVLPETPIQQPAAPSDPMVMTPEAAVADITPGNAPFRHLLSDAPAGNAQNALEIGQGSWQGSRYTPPAPPVRRSRVRTLTLPLLTLLLAITVAAGAWLDWWPSLNSLVSRRGDGGAGATTPAAEPTVAAQPPDATTSAAEPAAPLAETAPAPTPAAPVAEPAQPPTPAPAAVAATPVVASIEFAGDNYTVPPGESAARIIVRRSGDMSHKLSFSWWTENATAVADVDYISWGHRTAYVPAGQNSVTLLVPIINDSTRTAPRRFLVVIGSPGDDARLGATTRATVQISGGG